MNTTRAIIERANDGAYGIYTPDLAYTTLIGEGKTVAEAKKDFEICYQEILDFYKDENKPIPEELQDLQFKYEYDVSAVFDMNQFMNITKTAENININPSLLRQYVTGTSRASAKQKLKIQNGIRALGRQLAEITIV